MVRSTTAHHKSLRVSEHHLASPDFNYDIIAIDEHGNELYETDSADTEREAEQIVAELNDMEPPEGVHSFHYKERE